MLRGQPAPGTQPAHVGLLSPVHRPLADMAFRLVAVGYVAFSLADVLTTAYALANGGRERNPVAALVYTWYGMGGLLTFKAGVVGVIILTLRFMPRRPAVWVGTVFVAAMAIVVTANLSAIGPS